MRYVTHRIGGFDLPGRTKAYLNVPLGGASSTTSPEAAGLVYECLDCGYRTQAVGEMYAHQENQKKHHTWRQRLARWWAGA